MPLNDVSYSPSDCEFFSFARDSSKIVGPLFRSCQKEIRKFTIRPLLIPKQTCLFFSSGTFLIFARNKTENKHTTSTKCVHKRKACAEYKHVPQLTFLWRSHVQHIAQRKQKNTRAHGITGKRESSFPRCKNLSQYLKKQYIYSSVAHTKKHVQFADYDDEKIRWGKRKKDPLKYSRPLFGRTQLSQAVIEEANPCKAQS